MEDHGYKVVQIDDQEGGGGNFPRTGRFARGREPKREVRRCGRCGKVAVIVCQAWTQSVNGIQTGMVTRDCRCQACGAEPTLHDPRWIRGMKIVTAILALAILPLPIMLFLVWRWGRAWDQNPLVPDAPFPEVRFWRGPGNRRCGDCGQIAQLVSVTAHSTNGIPHGIECAYACRGCRRTFTTESVGGLIGNVLAACVLGGVGLLGWRYARTWGWLIGAVASVFVILLVGSAVRRGLAALRNPALDGADAAS